MKIRPAFQGALLLGLWICLFTSSLCYGDDKTVEAAGQPNKVLSSSELKANEAAELNEESKFAVLPPKLFFKKPFLHNKVPILKKPFPQKPYFKKPPLHKIPTFKKPISSPIPVFKIPQVKNHHPPIPQDEEAIKLPHFRSKSPKVNPKVKPRRPSDVPNCNDPKLPAPIKKICQICNNPKLSPKLKKKCPPLPVYNNPSVPIDKVFSPIPGYKKLSFPIPKFRKPFPPHVAP